MSTPSATPATTTAPTPAATAAPILALTPGERIRQAVDGRASTDDILHFWPAFGWTVLTLGLYAFYLFYRLMRRARDHNRRRVTLLLAAEELARQRALEQGKSDALRTAYQQVHSDVQSLRAMDGDLRDPTIWLLFSFVSAGLAWFVEAVLLDQDLVRHERHERAAETGLTQVFAQLGVSLPTPTPAAKQPHDYVARILAVVLTLGLYLPWWVADLMREGNTNVQQDHAWEDALATAVAGMATAAPRDATPVARDAQIGRS